MRSQESICYEDLIRSTRLFSGLDADHTRTLAAIAIPKTFSGGETVFRQGDTCPGLFIVDQGLVRIYRSGPNGQEHVLHLCGPKQCFAEVAVFGQLDLPANATAVQTTRCVVLPMEQMQQLITESHDLCRQLLASMAIWTRHFVQLLDDIVLRDATERVARYLSNTKCDPTGILLLPGPKKEIANHLNLTSETFSRVLRRLNNAGVLDTDSSRAIRVLDPDRLSDIGNQTH